MMEQMLLAETHGVRQRDLLHAGGAFGAAPGGGRGPRSASRLARLWAVLVPGPSRIRADGHLRVVEDRDSEAGRAEVAHSGGREHATDPLVLRPRTMEGDRMEMLDDVAV
jgi:hypothetical protein